MVRSLIAKLHLERYFSYKLILAIDLFLSVLASALALLFMQFMGIDMGMDLKTVCLCLLMALIASMLMFYLFKTYHAIIRHSSLRDMARMSMAIIGKELLLLAFALIPCLRIKHLGYIIFMDFGFTIMLLFIVRFLMIATYDMIRNYVKINSDTISVLVFGANDKSVALVKRLMNSPHYRVEGFVDLGKRLKAQYINGKRIYYYTDDKSVEYFKNVLHVEAILFSSESDARHNQDGLIQACVDCGVKVLIAPKINEVVDGKIKNNTIREIKIEDLLGRSEIEISMKEVVDNFSGKVVMVTGAAGSIGSELCRQLAKMGVKRLVLFDNGETPMHNLRLELEEKFPELDFVPIIGDVRLVNRLDFAFRTYHPQVVFPAAAYKHVPLMEENPCEAVLVNVAGSRNVANKCVEYGVEMMVMISTDKAVNPTNIMGCTKRLAEIYVQSLGLALEAGTCPLERAAGLETGSGEAGTDAPKVQTKFVTTRFGNVLGSNGSVIPRFREQILKGGPVTVTHPDIVRFFMTIPEACRLVMEAATMSTGNQIFVFDMGKSVKIDTLARRMITLAGYTPDKDIKIEYTGLRPGEKLFEEVLASTENTVPTSHKRIRIAKVREYDYTEACEVSDELERLSRAVNIPDMVRLMKKTVPEYKSKNSRFEEYDK